MSDRAIDADRVLGFAGAVCDEIAAESDFVEMDTILLADQSSRNRYLDYCWMHVALKLEMRVRAAAQKAHQQISIELGASVPSEFDVAKGETSTSPSPVPTFLSTAFRNTLNYLPEGMPIGYSMGALITGLGLWIFAHIYVSQPEPVAQNTPPSVTQRQFAPDAKIGHVGRITGMVDCKWEKEGSGGRGQGSAITKSQIPNPKFEIPSPQSPVSLGDKFDLASGLMEITYNTGAKVILQGPVTYEVESNGGYLEAGKLTGKLEKRGEGRGERGEVAAKHKSEIINQKSSLSTIHYPLSTPSNPQSLIPNPFVIHTPTATVIDLGTEFGVEVLESGVVSAHVFRGMVEVQLAAGDSQHGQTIRLSVNESARVEKQIGGNPTIRRVAADPVAFVRHEQLLKRAAEQQTPEFFHLWQAYSQKLRRDPSLVAYYDCQLKEGLPSLLPNVAANGDKSLDGVLEGITWSDGHMVGKHALQFNSIADYVRVVLPKRVDDLTLAAWVQVQSLDEQQIGLVMSSGWAKTGQIHWQLTNDGCIALDVYDIVAGQLPNGRNWLYKSEPVFGRQRLHQWTHIAAVYDHTAGVIRFYADGRPAGEVKIITITPLCIREARIGQWFNRTDEPCRSFHGRIDEMAIFGRPLPADEVQRMFEAGSTHARRAAQ